MSSIKANTPNLSKLTKEMVEEYLAANPDFFKEHPELLEKLKAPIAHHGDNVMDLQHFMVGNLQKKLQTLKSKYEGLITSSRDNMSTLNQVHTAVVDLVKAKDLEQLLEVITIDLMHLFGVDVVRLAIESEAADLYESTYSEQNYSGISFITPDACVRAIGKDKTIALIADAHKQFVYGFDDIFVDCSAQIASCALIALFLPITGRHAMLAFGVRHKDRFAPGQGVELLQFLGRIVEHRLDACLNSAGISGLI
jgi:uncharacterized protein YigA (DUF484 family)